MRPPTGAPNPVDEMKIQNVPGKRLPDATRDEFALDESLVQMLVDGSEDAFARLYARHAAAVLAEATRTSRDRWIGAEVVQETFLALWKRAELFDPSRGLLRAWLLTIARNRALDRLRRAKRHDRAAAFSSLGGNVEADPSTIEWLAVSGEPVAAARPEPGPEAWLSRKETRASIADAVTSLAPLERSVIALAYDEGLSQSEIADRLGWPIGTVKTRTRSALRHLRDRLVRSEGDVQARGAGVHRQNDGALAVAGTGTSVGGARASGARLRRGGRLLPAGRERHDPVSRR
jgi:RNA polymerase sigma-70 factor (ECF subfamily)